jgi:glycogen debranching enzyme
MSDGMFSGWGIRTLSSKEPRYNPIGYHLGTVWPHDNSLIAAGFRRYGFDLEACRVFTAIVEAAQHFEHYRLPEVFAGFERESYGVPSSGLGCRHRSLFDPGCLRPDARRIRAASTDSSPRIAGICALA